MSAVLLKAIRDLRRRKLQAAVVLVTAFLAVGTGTMALTLISQTTDPYHRAFAAQRGAHLQVAYDGQIDPATLAGTPGLIGASASGGPYAATDVQLLIGSHKVWVTTIGRDDPGGQVEQLRVTAGHWPADDHEIALTQSFADLHHIDVGDQLKVVSIEQQPQLTVAAKVGDIDEDVAGVTAGSGATGGRDVSGQHAWMLTPAIGDLRPNNASYFLMNYRFASDPTAAQLKADLASLRRTLPAGAISSSTDYLSVGTVFGVNGQVITFALLAFSVLALLATVAIVANLVTGIVISAYREIGIMKAIGFTPLQVDLVFVLQMLIPVVIASVVAIPVGSFAIQPVLSSSSQTLGIAYQPAYSPVLDAIAFIGAVAIVTATALLAALRAGWLRPAAIIAGASAPHGRSGRSLRRLGAALHLPRPVALGLGDAFSRPLRAILTIVAVFVGVITFLVAIGLSRDITALGNSQTSAGHLDVVVRRSPAISDAEAMRLITADGQTAHVVAELTQPVAVPGVANPVPARMFRGDSSNVGFLLVKGRWYQGPGEVVAPRALMQDAHVGLGDHLTITVANRPVDLVLVGEVYDLTNLGYSLFFDWSNVSSLEPDTAPNIYLINVTHGAGVDAYVRRLAATQPDLLDVQNNDTTVSGTGLDFNSVLPLLALIVILIGAAGVFNTLLLNTRERVRDTATLKALGMTRRQVMTMIGASAVLLALIGGLIAVPAGLVLNRVLLTFLGGIGGNDTPPGLDQVFATWELLAIPVAGVVVAIVASLIPARWAARANVVEALHAE